MEDKSRREYLTCTFPGGKESPNLHAVISVPFWSMVSIRLFPVMSKDEKETSPKIEIEDEKRNVGWVLYCS